MCDAYLYATTFPDLQDLLSFLLSIFSHSTPVHVPPPVHVHVPHTVLGTQIPHTHIPKLLALIIALMSELHIFLVLVQAWELSVIVCMPTVLTRSVYQ